LTQEHRLQGLAGIYKQNDGSTFVVLIKGNDLYLKVDSANEELLTPGGDGLYSVGDTNAKIKFNITAHAIAASLTFYLKDRQTVATKDLQILKEKTFFEKFRELGIAIVVFFALIGVFLVSYTPIKNSCLTSNSKTLCRLALVGAKVLGKNEDTLALSTQESKSEYTQIKEVTKSECNNGNSKACLEVAKSLLRISDEEKAIGILSKSCLDQKDAQACGLWHETLISNGSIEEAYKISKDACALNIGLSCHQLAWKYKKENDMARSISFFTKACDNGEEKSCHELGMHHLKFDRKLSYSFFKSACKSYHRQSCDFKEKIEKFFNQQSRCNDKKVPRACFITASFEEDYGDLSLSLKMFKSACQKGSRLACDRVKKKEALQRLKENKEKIETI
jgi:hypothetical protein